jgi:hypothetical protein
MSPVGTCLYSVCRHFRFLQEVQSSSYNGPTSSSQLPKNKPTMLTCLWRTLVLEVVVDGDGGSNQTHKEDHAAPPSTRDTLRSCGHSLLDRRDGPPALPDRLAIPLASHHKPLPLRNLVRVAGLWVKGQELIDLKAVVASSQQRRAWRCCLLAQPTRLLHHLQ